jgi:hypothetical protein
MPIYPAPSQKLIAIVIPLFFVLWGRYFTRALRADRAKG